MHPAAGSSQDAPLVARQCEPTYLSNEQAQPEFCPFISFVTPQKTHASAAGRRYIGKPQFWKLPRNCTR